MPHHINNSQEKDTINHIFLFFISVKFYTSSDIKIRQTGVRRVFAWLCPSHRHRCAHHVGLRVRSRAHLSVQRRWLWCEQRKRAWCADRLWWGRWANHRWVRWAGNIFSKVDVAAGVFKLKLMFPVQSRSGGRLASPQVSEPRWEQSGRGGQRS